MRPIFHFTEKRIEAHICICFIAYKLYKELQRLLPLYGIDMSIDKVLNIAKTITTVSVNPPNGSTTTQKLFITDEQKSIKPLFDAISFSNAKVRKRKRICTFQNIHYN